MGFIVCLRGLASADPWLGERDLHCDACHPSLKKNHLLWPAPSVQSHFLEKKKCVPFDVFMVWLQQSLKCLCCHVCEGDVSEDYFHLSKSQVYIAVIHI